MTKAPEENDQILDSGLRDDMRESQVTEDGDEEMRMSQELYGAASEDDSTSEITMSYRNYDSRIDEVSLIFQSSTRN